MEGGDLEILLKKKKIFSEEECKFYAAQIFLALEYLHDSNIIHRDIKPGNIFLNADGYIKVGDFGVSRKLENSFHRTKTYVGTPLFIPPEVIHQKEYDFSADWWAYGVTLYQLATGTFPFDSTQSAISTYYFKIFPFILIYSSNLSFYN